MPANPLRKKDNFRSNHGRSKNRKNDGSGSPPVPTHAFESKGKSRGSAGPRKAPAHIGVVTAFAASASRPAGPIRYDTAENVIQASAHALAIGKPLGYHLTIRWPGGDWLLHELVRTKLQDWLSPRGGAFYVWSRESTGGPHSHFLLYLPPGLNGRDCRRRVLRWLKAATGERSLPAGTLNCHRTWTNGGLFQNITNLTSYILKGADATTRLVFGIEQADHGIVYGQRCGISHTLNRKSRKEAGGCLPSCHRKPTHDMVEVALDRLREREREKWNLAPLAERAA